MERYDIAIVGSGPAGLSAALNAKIRNKKFIIFGNKELSHKLSKAPKINNYLGFYGVTGAQVRDKFLEHIDNMGIEITEERVNNISSVTEMLEKGMTPEDILKEVMGDMDVEFTDKIETGFVCNCSKKKIAKALASISKKDMDEIINDGKEIEVKCDFCNTTYKFSVEELQTLRKQFR